MTLRSTIISLFASLSVLLPTLPASAAETQLQPLLLKLLDEDPNLRSTAITALARSGDKRVEKVLEYFRLGSLNNWNGKIVVYKETVENDNLDEFALLLDPLTGNPLLENGTQVKAPLGDLEEISPTRDERQQVRGAEVLLRLSSPDPESRIAAIKKCGQPPRNSDALPFLEEIAATDQNESIRFIARESILLIHLTQNLPDQKPGQQLDAARQLGEIRSMRALPVLKEMLASEATAVDAKKVCLIAVNQIQSHQGFVNKANNVLQGLSLGSVLILMALGLAITFGLMGVINMAHGELMMIGAYTTYEMQRLFNHTPDHPANYYYIVALPASFLAAAAVGMIIELTVVRHLYRRPLESLLATWGVGLILIQLVRIRYGDNIGVNAPDWARGGVEVMQDVIIPYARIYFFAVCGGCVAAIYYLMNKTPFGMKIRATMQNRDMASSLGVNTKKVDLYTFALGSGIAGVAGYAWTLIGGVTPDMGQQIFIVDSFLVVVTGGVGELLGVICSGLGIGLLTKFVEPLEVGTFMFGPVWAKILILIAIVGFIQFKPAGLFAPKGRLSDV